MITFWAGSQESFDAVVKAKESLATFAAASGGNMPDTPPTWEKQGSLAIVPVQGSLIDGYAGWLSMFGITGYGEITDALLAAAADNDVTAILLDVRSGGGAVSGVQAVADLVDKLGNFKPVMAHVTNAGASAAYWVMAPASSISLDNSSLVGSIGVMQIHTSYSRQLETDGVDKTIVRSGEYKALGTPFEPLSGPAKAEMQGQVDDLAGIFKAHVAKHRNISAADTGDGRVYLGKRAITAGLADKVQTRDQAIASAKKIDKAKSVPNNRNKS